MLEISRRAPPRASWRAPEEARAAAETLDGPVVVKAQIHAGARHGFLAMKLGASETALQLEDDAAEAAVADEEVIAAPDDLDRQLLALGIRQRQADVLHVLRHDEDVGGSPDPQGGVEAEGFLEPDLALDLS